MSDPRLTSGMSDPRLTSGMSDRVDVEWLHCSPLAAQEAHRPPLVARLALPRALVLRNVFSPAECRRLIAAAELVGFRDIASTQRAYRDHERLVARCPDLAAELWRRIAPHLLGDAGGKCDDTGEGARERLDLRSVTLHEGTAEAMHHGWDAQGEWRPLAPQPLGEVLRFGKYSSGGHFGVHYDGCVQRGANERSMYSVQVYLNGGGCFGGGALLFVSDGGSDGSGDGGGGGSGGSAYETRGLDLFSDAGAGRYHAPRSMVCAEVKPEAGTVVVFAHRLLHEGERVCEPERAPAAGREPACEFEPKYFMRTDMYFGRDAAHDPARRHTPQQRAFYAALTEAEAAEADGRVAAAVALYRRAEKACPRLWAEHRI
eukprot:g4124.t1